MHCTEVKGFDVILMLPRFVFLKYCKKAVDLFASQFRNHVFWNEELISYVYLCLIQCVYQVHSLSIPLTVADADETSVGAKTQAHEL